MKRTGPPKQQEPIPIDQADKIIFSPNRPQSICDISYAGSLAINTTVGALLNIFLNPGRSATLGFSFLNISVKPLINSGLSTTRTSHDCLFIPLGALIPHSTIVCIFSRSTASGLYFRILRRLIIVSTTGFTWLTETLSATTSFCREPCDVQLHNTNMPAPTNINLNNFICYHIWFATNLGIFKHKKKWFLYKEPLFIC